MFISRHVVFDETSFTFKNPQGRDSVLPSDQWMSIFDLWTTFPITKTDSSMLPIGSCDPTLPSPDLPHPSPPLDVIIEPASSIPTISSALTLASTLPEHAPFNPPMGSFLPSATSDSMHPDSDMTPMSHILYSQHSDSQFGASPGLPESSVTPELLELSKVQNQQMATRSQLGIHKPNHKYAHIIVNQAIPRTPHSVKAALGHAGWRAAMQEEMDALHHNNTWTLLLRDHTMHVIGSKWVFKPKLKPDGSLDRLKARVVAKGYHQLDGIDYINTFSLVIKPGTIRLVISLTLVRHWDIRQLDVKNAFLHGLLFEDIYMEQPSGMADPMFPNHVCKLQRALY